MNEQLKAEAMELAIALSKMRYRELAKCDEFGHSIINQQRVARLERIFRQAADRWLRRAGFIR